MHPISHLLIGWALANTAGLEKRDRMLVTVAGVVPDLDGLGVIADILTEKARHPLYLYDTYHHVLMHNLGFGLLLALLALSLGRRRICAGGLVILSFHLHLLGDLVGSRGPDGYQWPIPYLWPFSEAWQLAWSHQWGLKAWPNVSITVVLLALTLYWAWKRGRSPLELVSGKGDAALVRTLRHRFGDPSRSLHPSMQPGDLP
jgi:inner membrane protein